MSHTENKTVPRLRELALQSVWMVDRTCHELRRPMAVIAANAELLADGIAGPLSDEQAEHVAAIRRGLARLDRTTVDLYTICGSLVEPAVLEDLDVAPLIEELVRARQLTQGASTARLSARIRGPLPQGRFDRERLLVALERLFDHVLRYAAPGSGVVVRAWAAGERLRITVRAAGHSLSNEETERAFDYLHRPERVRASRNDPGGSDLTVCRALIESFGGRVWAARRRANATSYSIELDTGAGE